jgi:hypothetical protein
MAPLLRSATRLHKTAKKQKKERKVKEKKIEFKAEMLDSQLDEETTSMIESMNSTIISSTTNENGGKWIFNMALFDRDYTAVAY